jgi:large subunit ribosomal protein L36
VRIPAESFSPFTIVVHRIRRPLHPGRFRHADDVLDWHREIGDRGTVLAVTGDEVDATEIAALLTGCELTEAEMASSPGTNPRPLRPEPDYRNNTKEQLMKVRNSLRALKKIPGAQTVRRRGRTFVINKKNPWMKARQG